VKQQVCVNKQQKTFERLASGDNLSKHYLCHLACIMIFEQDGGTWEKTKHGTGMPVRAGVMPLPTHRLSWWPWHDDTVRISRVGAHATARAVEWQPHASIFAPLGAPYFPVVPWWII